MTEQHMCVGTIIGAFGVRGELRIKSYCAEPEALGDYSPLFSEDGKRQFTVTILRPIKGGFSARIDSVFTKEDADLLRGIKLFADRAMLPNLPDDEYYHTDLIGLEVIDTGGIRLGHITNVANHGASDLLEVAPNGGGETVLVPFTMSVVPTVDLAAKRVIIDPPVGIFDS